MTLVAVYGTLRQGYENHRKFLNHQRPAFRKYVQVPFRMYASDAYPMLIASQQSSAIFIEGFEVDSITLERLDRLEAPYNFSRTTVFLPEVNRDAEIYVYNGAAPPPGFAPVASGKWGE
jgi:gamma-glutamylcyclotransferase (GGCT)/AIG2-like uncharacterized protein YtfP